MRHLVLIFSVLVCSALSTACGFSPVYGTHSGGHGVENQLSHVMIDQIPNREGQVLRNELIDRLHGGSHVKSGRYRLTSSFIVEQRRNFDITEDADSTRTQLRLTMSFNLIDQDAGQTVLTRKLEAFSSYNILDSQFTTRVSRDNARENALIDLARQIETQLLLYFSE